MIIVIAVVILLLVFVMFSLDDHEDEPGFLSESEESEAPVKSAEVQETSRLETPPEKPDTPPLAAEPAPIRRLARSELPESVTIEPGSEDDLRLRVQLDQRLPAPTSTEAVDAVVAAVQLRFPEEVLEEKDSFLKLVVRAESVFDKAFSFDYSCFSATQLGRLWLFGHAEGRDDALFEALVVSFEVVSRFKKLLESDSMLRESKARISVGLAMGKLIRINRGVSSEPSWVGRATYLAETLAEAAGDFSIYVDEDIHKAALPLFDFREWKPIKLRSPLPPIPLYELVGWNNPDEIAAFASHKDAWARRAVAVAYRYLDIGEKFQPLIELLSDPDEKVAIEALETVKVIGNDHSLGLLKRIFPETQDAIFRSAIIDAFASIGRKEVVPVILGSTKEASWKVRLSAARALFILSSQDSLRHLEHLLSDNDGAVKACVNGIFYRATSKQQYLDALAELIVDLSKRTRKAAVDALLEINGDAVLKILVAAFPEQDLELQKHILRRMQESKSKILYHCFLTLFKNSGEKIRPSIVESIRRAGLVS